MFSIILVAKWSWTSRNSSSAKRYAYYVPCVFVCLKRRSERNIRNIRQILRIVRYMYLRATFAVSIALKNVHIIQRGKSIGEASVWTSLCQDIENDIFLEKNEMKSNNNGKVVPMENAVWLGATLYSLFSECIHIFAKIKAPRTWRLCRVASKAFRPTGKTNLCSSSSPSNRSKVSCFFLHPPPRSPAVSTMPSSHASLIYWIRYSHHSPRLPLLFAYRLPHIMQLIYVFYAKYSSHLSILIYANASNGIESIGIYRICE